MFLPRVVLMGKFVSLFFLCLIVQWAGMDQARADALPLEIVCTQWRPYIFRENAVLSGPVYDIAKQVLDRAGITFEYKIEPWARVYHNGLTVNNYLIGCLGRTPARENLFHWIGPVTQGIDVYFYKLKSNPIIVTNLEQARQYKVVTERGSYNHDFLRLQGFDKERIFPMTSNEQAMSLLSIKRYPLYLISEDRMVSLAKFKGIDPSIFERVLFAFSVKDYLAFSRNTSSALVKKVAAAYEALQAEGKIILPK